MTRSWTTPSIGRPCRVEEPAARVARPGRRPGTPCARRRSAPARRRSRCSIPCPTVPMPTMAMSAVRARAITSLIAGSAAARPAPPPTAAKPERGGTGRSPRGARPVPAPTPGRRRATPPSSIRRPAERPPRFAADPPRPPRPSPAATCPRTAPVPTVAQGLVQPLGGQLSDSLLSIHARPERRHPDVRQAELLAQRLLQLPCTCSLPVHTDFDDALRACRRQHARHVGPTRTQHACDVVLRAAVQEVHPGRLDQGHSITRRRHRHTGPCQSRW